MRKWLAVVALLLVSRLAFSCGEMSGEDMNALSRKVESYISGNRGASKINFEAISSACKLWSRRPGMAIFVKPYEYSYEKSNSEVYLGAAVAIIDGRTGSILGVFDERRLMIVDAIEPSVVKIDTANYKLSDSEIAFGVRVSRGNNSNVSPFREEVMNMYVFDGELKRVVDRLLIGKYGGEGDGRCEFRGEGVKSYISTGSKSFNGYFPIIVNQIKHKIEFFMKDGVCKKMDSAVDSTRSILRFDGVGYEIPQFLKSTLD